MLEASGALAVPSWDSAALCSVEAWQEGAASGAGVAERPGRAVSPLTKRRSTASGKEHLWRCITQAGGFQRSR